jgi:hypothetical protein
MRNQEWIPFFIEIPSSLKKQRAGGKQGQTQSLVVIGQVENETVCQTKKGQLEMNALCKPPPAMPSALLLLFFLVIFSTSDALVFPGYHVRISRRGAVEALVASAFAPLSAATAFDGGIGGLGKTKPETGVVLREGSAPIQNSKGIVSVEILSGRGNPILVEFRAPFPLLPTTSGLEARDLQQPESAFVQVIDGVSRNISGKALNQVFINNVFGSKGKYVSFCVGL